MGNARKLRKSPQGRISAAQKLTDRILEIQGTLSGRYNGYICETCRNGFLTLDVDRGITPMLLKCFATEGCSGVARSMGYPDGPPPEELGEPIIYWYKPSKEEFNKLSLEMQEYVRGGGLVRKATEAAPEWVKTAT